MLGLHGPSRTRTTSKSPGHQRRCRVSQVPPLWEVLRPHRDDAGLIRHGMSDEQSLCSGLACETEVAEYHAAKMDQFLKADDSYKP